MAEVAPAGPSWCDVGIAGRPLRGQSVSGDAAFVSPAGDALVLAVVDGLGHGRDAAMASQTAVRTLAANVDAPMDRLFHHVHLALGRTRGAVMTVARLDPSSLRLTWCAVGNVEGYLSRSDGSRERVLAAGGIVGHNLPRLRVATLPLRDGDRLVLATDGIRHDLGDVRHFPTAQAAVDMILERGALPTDDALVLVAAFDAEAR